MIEIEQQAIVVPDRSVLPRGNLLQICFPAITALLISCGIPSSQFEDKFIKVMGSFPNTLDHPENGRISFTFKPSALSIRQKRYEVVWKTFKLVTLSEKVTKTH